MKKLTKYTPVIVILLFFTWHSIGLAQQQRFPRPEFETGYTFPVHQFLNQRASGWEYMDVAVLIASLAVASWMVIVKRSRQGILMVSAFSLVYFGFYRQGCICAIGSVQNLSLALFNSDYAMPLAALLFFAVPLIFALLFGRVFCAGVCPLGAIQELTGFRQAKISPKLESILGAIPFIYLGLAVLFSATKSQFLICRYDPFVGIFRLGAPYTMIVFGSLLLITGIFINRPYCRYLCPYGVLQNIFSRFSWKHLKITPAECRNCRLCEPSCPYNAILASDPREQQNLPEEKPRPVYLAMIVVTVIAASVLFYNMAPLLAYVNNTVSLAKEIRLENETGIKALSEQAVAFNQSGKTEEELYNEAENITDRFRKGAPWVGAFLGLSLGLGLYRRTLRPVRAEYEPDRGRCVSCGKCFKYCPVKIKK